MAMKDISDYQVCKAYADYNAALIKRTVSESMAYITAVLNNCAQPDPPNPFPYERLAQETGQSEKVCFKCLERANDRGYIEFGVSLRTGWLTNKGKALLGEQR